MLTTSEVKKPNGTDRTAIVVDFYHHSYKEIQLQLKNLLIHPPKCPFKAYPFPFNSAVMWGNWQWLQKLSGKRGPLTSQQCCHTGVL